MKLLLLLMSLMILTCSVSPQSPKYSYSYQQSKKLIADETWMSYTKTQVKIETSNDTIAGILKRQGGFNKVMSTKKTDRKGDYWCYTFYYPKEGFKMPVL